MNIEVFGPQHVDGLGAFAAEMGPGELAVIKEDIGDPDARAKWAADGRHCRWVALDRGEVVGFGALIPLAGWSSHVGEIRVVTRPSHRRRGLGTAMAGHLLGRAIVGGLAKVTVEVVAGDAGTLGLFEQMGFRPEAQLADHIRDRNGRSRDLVLLAHDVEQVRASLDSTSAADSLYH
ncbi:GNAT family N-acetyltransferase [Epidermidibacterium keratini]|uniref:GNAT family N-acetyltransferase n=1 Tax=Epidermidibacterium keratini TaxID=1891644 RepID=A0A7L4YNU8_9ACTN|nr:GNAT family N-acetyltransferase [Epidermidibacterium keratini]QHC00816.1 GNAT family N-acetyltransferase [Epidermidibacterium keratini]